MVYAGAEDARKFFSGMVSKDFRYTKKPDPHEPTYKPTGTVWDIFRIVAYLQKVRNYQPPEENYEEDWQHVPPVKPADPAVIKLLLELFEQEPFVSEKPRAPTSGMTEPERDFLLSEQSKYDAWLENAGQYVYPFAKVRLDLHELLRKHLPSLGDEPGHIQTRLLDAIRDVPDFMRDLINLFKDRKPDNYPNPFFTNLNRTIAAHQGTLLQSLHKGFDPTTHPSNNRWKLATDYFRNTPLMDLFTAQLPFRIPWNERHGLIVAPTGSGKSQLIEALIWEFLSDPKQPSIVLIDSKGGYKSLFERISRLEVFHPDYGEHRHRLKIIDVLEEPALGMFASPEKGGHIHTALQDVIKAWPGAGEYTSLQQRIMNHVIPLILAMNGNLTDAIEALENPHQEKFDEVMDKLSEETRTFWQKYDPKNYSASLPGLIGRLDLIRSTEYLGRMFNSKEHKLNLSKEMDQGSIVLISTSKAELSAPISNVLANFFVAQVFSAGVRRGKRRRPTYLIVDEAINVISDVTAENFITLREYNVRCIYAVVSAREVASKGYWNTVANQTQVRLAGGLEGAEISAMQEYMGRNCTVDFLYEQQKEPAPEGHNSRYVRFGCSVRGVTFDDPIGLIIPTGIFENQGFMSDAAYEAVRRKNRETLQATYVEPDLPTPEPEPKVKPKRTDQWGRRKP
jgi:hypothetical protein